MSIPQRADKWIVFALISGLGVVQLLRSTVPGGFDAIKGLAVAIILGVVVTLLYIVWCAICRLMARLLGVVPGSGKVRLIANVGFFVIMLALMFVPYERTVTIRLPVG